MLLHICECMCIACPVNDINQERLTMSLFNKTKLKEKILRIAQMKGRKVFTRVSMAEMEPKCEAAVARFLDGYIHQLPSKKTIK